MRHDSDRRRDAEFVGDRPHGPHGRPWEGRQERRGSSGHGDRPRGRGGRRGRGGGRRVGKGDVRAAILLLLDEVPLHGYQLIHRIEEDSGGLWRPSPGSVYPALQLLEDERLIRPEQEEGRRVFHLTESGKAYVSEQRTELEAAREAVTDRMNPQARALHDLVHQLTAAVDQVSEVGTAAQLDAAQSTLVATR